MATWAIGDVQGCYATLQGLLERIAFDPARDRLWLVGDLVNRGPASLDVLRWARDLGDRLVAVLGNHDLHLLAIAAGIRRAKRKDTLEEVLQAPDREELLEWLRRRPLLHREEDRLLVHAGLLPVWSCEQSARLAREAEAQLQGPEWQGFLATLYAPPPETWSERLSEQERLRLAVATMTRMRGCGLDGRTPDFEHKGPPAELPEELVPWFAHPERRCREVTIVAGHWAALGLHVADGVIALDTGCVWGDSLSACRLEDGEVVQELRAG